MIAVLAAVFAVAVLYSSVGHGGASGYLAVLSLFGIAGAAASTSALALNILVAGIAWVAFRRAGHFSWKLLAPLAIVSVPAAALGGRLPVSATLFHYMLAFALACAAVRMFLPDLKSDALRPPVTGVLAVAGGAIGLLSGVVGIGGGIFLSPMMMLLRWAEPKRVAAVCAGFIVLNSIAGLGGRLARGPLEILPLGGLVAAAFAGGLLGGWLGARKLAPRWLRAVLGVVLLVAAVQGLRAS